MIDAFVEGVRSNVQACHLVILAPLAMMLVAARGRWEAVAGALIGVMLGGWIFVTRWFVPTDAQLRLSAVFVIGALILVAVTGLDPRERLSWIGRIGPRLRSPWTAAGAPMAVATLVALWWRPCVGEELGEILTVASREPVGQLLPTIGFMLGISIPLLVIGLIYAAWRPGRELATRIGWVATAVGVVLAGSVVVGRHGEIVARLFEWSQ